MKIIETVGIDVSKLTIDVVIHSNGRHKQFKNGEEGFQEMIKWLLKNCSAAIAEVLLAFEHTGLYSLPLSIYLSDNKIAYTLIPGLELKKSLGIARGKDDKVDAKSIALYAYRRREELEPYELPSKNLLEMRRLLSLRDKLVKQCSGYKATSTEIRSFLKKEEHPAYFEAHENMIKALTGGIRGVEKRLRELTEGDAALKKQHELITSITGVGDVTAWFMITYTNGFTLFEDARKFATYAGTAPFPNRSGTSLQGKTRISNLGNLKFKSLLSNCATTAISCNPELRLYYKRRIEEGKHKMSTLNIVRNKILGRIFAVVERGTPYVDTMKFAQ